MSTAQTGLANEEASEDFFEVIEAMVKAQTSKISVGCPGIVRKYTPSTGKLEVQPVIRSRRDTGETYQGPVLVGVPVCWPQFGSYSITGPLNPGDFVWLWFGDRSIEEWLAQGGDNVEPVDKRRFSSNDAVAYPGISTFKTTLANAQLDGMTLGHDTGRGSPGPGLRININDSGIEIGDGVNDLLSMLDELMTVLKTGFYGPWPMSPATILLVNAIQLQLAFIKKP